MRKPRLALFSFRLGVDEFSARGGTGVEFASIERFLQAQDHRICLRIIPCLPNPHRAETTRQRFAANAANLWKDTRRLIAAPDELLLLVYPKVPFIGHSRSAKVLTAAFAAYFLLRVKTRWSGQKIIVLITDLPVEQARMTEPVRDQHELDQALASMRGLRNLPLAEQLLSRLEGLIFKAADCIVSLSPTMTEHIVRKHGLDQRKILLRGRNAFVPTLATAPTVCLPATRGLRVFYSGDLARPTAVDNLRQLNRVFELFPESHFYLCGQDGGWVQQEAQENDQRNVHYLGALDHATHDAVAQQCDVGIIAYTHAYAHLVPTTKYSAYVASGLAVLCSDLVTLSEVIREDGVGVSVPVQEMTDVLERWLREPELVRPYQEQARRIAPSFSSGTFRQDWFEPLLTEIDPQVLQVLEG